jgi:hypothetical protein
LQPEGGSPIFACFAAKIGTVPVSGYSGFPLDEGLALYTRRTTPTMEICCLSVQIREGVNLG